VTSGGDALRRFAAFQTIAEGEDGANWRLWRQGLRDGEAKAINEAIQRNPQVVEFAFFCQWLADRQLSRAAERARESGLEIGFYRDLAVGAAPDGAECWAHAGALARGVTIGAPPDPFSIQGQNWSLPAPNPLAGAREGWASLCAVYRANMRHAGMLRIDHAMGLRRLFLIPEGAAPAEGAYLSYPLDDLIGHIALESRRARCMVVGEDLGTVPEGFRDRLTQAKILGMRVLWFERNGAKVRPPEDYPPISVACVATHDLETLAGWWQGADIAERLSLGLLTLVRAGDEIAARREEKRGLIAALLAAGLIFAAPSEDAPLSDAIAAAVHALIGGSGSILAHAQFDDLVGETVQTNLPGTDRERPNWRIKVGPDVGAAFAAHRARAILAALAKGRT
jgi:4-alpha-glucanotransferase